MNEHKSGDTTEVNWDVQPTSEDYVHFDEREDVLSSLELLTTIAPVVGDQPQLWKWMIVGTQNALQGSMVCALVDSTGTSVLKKNSAAKMLAWLQGKKEGENPPEERLEEFKKLLEKCESELGLSLETAQRKDITRLHDHFRNSFAHFTPKGWGIEKAGLPRIITSGLDAVEQLMAMDRMGVRLDVHQSKRYKASLASVRDSLAALDPKTVAEGSAQEQK